MKPAREGDPIAPKVVTTLQKTIVPDPIPADAETVLPHELTKYEQNGYGKWSYGPGLDPEKRLDLMPAGYDGASATAGARLLRFFSITDIHITDVQSPAQAIFFGYKGFLSSAYSGVMMYTHHILDAAMQTVNAMHVDPDSGVRGDAAPGPRAEFLDAYEAARLDRSIPCYQTRGNHDHFFTGVLRVDDYLRKTYVGDEILNLGNIFQDALGPGSRGIYMGCLDGWTPHGDFFG